MTTNIYKALAAAQAEMASPHFDSTNPHYKSRFASLKEITKVAKAALTKHGVFVSQIITPGGDQFILCATRFADASGEFIEIGPTPFPVTRNDPQGYGSAITYARRYSLSAALCLVADDDDDGEAATDAAAKPITEKQAADILALIEDVGADKQKFLNHIKVKSIEAIPASMYHTAIAKLEQKRAAA